MAMSYATYGATTPNLSSAREGAKEGEPTKPKQSLLKPLLPFLQHFVLDETTFDDGAAWVALPLHRPDRWYERVTTWNRGPWNELPVALGAMGVYLLFHGGEELIAVGLFEGFPQRHGVGVRGHGGKSKGVIGRSERRVAKGRKRVVGRVCVRRPGEETSRGCGDGKSVFAGAVENRGEHCAGLG